MRLPERISAIVELWRRLKNLGWQAAVALQLFQRVSELAAASPDDEPTQVGESALSVEVYLSSFIDSNLTPSPHQLSELGRLLESLIAAGETSSEPAGSGTEIAAAPGNSPLVDETPTSIFYFGTDTDLRQALPALLEVGKFELTNFDTVGSLLSALERSAPLALIIDTESLAAECVGIGEFSDASRKLHAAPTPFLVVGHSKELTLRLEAMRAGADAFFVAPVSPVQIRDRIQLIHERNKPELHRVLVVEDDPAQADFATRVLSKAGFQTVAVTDPLKVIDLLEDFRPDLILMDLYMPGVSGTELTTILREHKEYASVPIVFLSGEVDEEKQFRALSVGGDDFLPKPIRPKHLIDTVRHRIERTRSVQNRLGTRDAYDPVTKLFNRHHFIQSLERALENRTVLPPACALLLLDIDEPERLHEQVGIGGADEVLATIGSIITSAKQPVDIAARFGDHSFCIFARRNERSEIQQFAGDLAATLSGHLFELATAALKITTSIGVAYQGFDVVDASSLLTRAEKACVRALRNGGNRIEVYVPQATDIDSARKMKFMLQDAVANRCFKLLYQPITSLRGLKGNRYHVQLSIEDEDGIKIPENQFRPLAKEIGLDSAIDQFMLDQTAEVLRNHNLIGNRFTLVLSLSGATLELNELASVLAQRLKKLQLSTQAYILEFCFEDVKARLRTAINVLTHLRRFGFSTCIRNFRPEPVNFSLLDELPTIYIRLLPSILDLAQDELAEIISEIHRRNRVVIATGVKDAKQVNKLWVCSTDYLQGDFIQPALETPNYESGKF